MGTSERYLGGQWPPGQDMDVVSAYPASIVPHDPRRHPQLIDVADLLVGMTVLQETHSGFKTDCKLLSRFITSSRFPDQEMCFRTERGLVRWVRCGKVWVR